MVSDVVRNGESIVDKIHIGLKSANGTPVTYTLNNIAQSTSADFDRCL